VLIAGLFGKEWRNDVPQVRQLTDRQEVYKAINGERDYQDSMKGNAARENIDDNRDLGSLIVFIETYTSQAALDYSGPHPEGREKCLHTIRKVAALCVLAMEYHGTYARKA
jgi:hypothetical protein